MLSVELPPEAEAIRADVRAELAPALELEGAAQKTYLAEKGYTAPHFTAPWGKSADAVSQLVIAEELRAAKIKPHDMIIGNWVIPTLIAHGNEEQLAKFVPPSLRGDIVWCQLFSEPGAGSDLAALSTKATKVDGGWKLQGQKVWTSMARDAHWGICLARTDADAPKHKGLSYFLIDIKNSGLDIRRCARSPVKHCSTKSSSTTSSFPTSAWSASQATAGSSLAPRWPTSVSRCPTTRRSDRVARLF